jgi:hypothetical protein
MTLEFGKSDPELRPPEVRHHKLWAERLNEDRGRRLLVPRFLFFQQAAAIVIPCV